MAADGAAAQSAYQTTHQRVISQIGAGVMLIAGVVVLYLTTVRGPGGFILAPIEFLIAAGGLRFSRCRVQVVAGGVHVVNMLETIKLTWDEISEFELRRIGQCAVRLKDGRRIGITGIQQTNLAGMRNKQDTRERRMIDALNDLVRMHANARPDVAPPATVTDADTSTSA